MGYSLSVSCKSNGARDKLAAFLREHTRPFSQVMGDSPELEDLKTLSRVWALFDADNLVYDPTQYIRVGYELAYGGSPSKVGFNFSTQGDYGPWMNNLLRWAALRVGRRRGLNALSEVGKAYLMVPYTCYDSTPTPVLTADMVKDWYEAERKHAQQRGWLVDELGFHPYPKHLDRFDTPGDPEKAKLFRQWDRKIELVDIVVRRELERLDALWKSRSGDKPSA